MYDFQSCKIFFWILKSKNENLRPKNSLFKKKDLDLKKKFTSLHDVERKNRLVKNHVEKFM